MPDLPADLAAAIDDQAKARVEMNIQGYAKYLTPEAVDSLRASFPGMPPRVNQFEIASVEVSGGDHTVDVRYSARGGDPFIVRSRWRSEAGGWKVVHAERLWGDDEKRPGFLSKLAAKLLRPLANLRRR